jgi:hypothetical protein
LAQFSDLFRRRVVAIAHEQYPTALPTASLTAGHLLCAAHRTDNQSPRHIQLPIQRQGK